MPTRGRGNNRFQPLAAQGGSRSAQGGRPETSRDRAGRGGASTPERRGSVRDMIQRMSQEDTQRDKSPSKKRRVSCDKSDSDSSEKELDCSSTSPVTEGMLNSVMLRMTQQIKMDTSSEFVVIQNQILQLGNRIEELEKHVEERDAIIFELEACVKERDDRIDRLEVDLDDVATEQRQRDLMFSGLAVPPKPSREWWKEDVKATTADMLAKFLPQIAVRGEDIEQCERMGRSILCRFRSGGKESVRERIYWERFDGRKMKNDSGEDISLFVNENITERKQRIMEALLREKKAERV